MKAFGKIFRESFNVDSEWSNWFLNKVARSEDALAIDVDGHTASVALLSPYKMEFHGAEVPVCYINSVATERKYRGRGLGTRLMIKALSSAAERGDDFAVLIPATHRLYFFYDAFGFATVFYVDEQRYTALHQFNEPSGYAPVAAGWELFHELESARKGAVLHSEEDFEHILSDLSLSNGKVIAVDNGAGSSAMVFFELTEREVHVLDILSTDDAAAEAALHQMRLNAENLSVIVKATPTDRKAELRSRGMARILNVDSVLSHLAAAHPKVSQVIRVTDRLIPSNNGIYILRDGQCEKVSQTHRRITLDVSVEVLCKIIFSAERIGGIFDLPTSRPFISLMLD